MELTYRIGGRTEKLKGLCFSDLFCYPDSDTVFLLTNDNLNGRPEIVDIESGIRYKYDGELDVIKVTGKIEIRPIK